MSVYYSIPFNSDKNIGKYYNDFMNILPNDNDYACFVDGDTIFTTYNYGNIIENVIKRYPDIDCFTALTNRVNCQWQIAPGIDKSNNDIEYHREYGLNISKIYNDFCYDVTDKKLFSGFFILIKKSTWREIGKFVENGMLGVDNDIHEKIKQNNKKMFLMKGLYLYHWYRNNNNKYTSHLI
jgi:hypothetical protein